jgi:hypothetical protein
LTALLNARSEFIDQRFGFVGHLQKLWPLPMIVFTGQLSGRVEAHVGADVLLGRRVIE